MVLFVRRAKAEWEDLLVAFSCLVIPPGLPCRWIMTRKTAGRRAALALWPEEVLQHTKQLMPEVPCLNDKSIGPGFFGH